MPELPEAETVRTVLEEQLKGKTILRVTLGRPTFYRKPPPGALEGLVGLKVEAVRRRGKYILLVLTGGREFVLHLGMSGRLVIGEPGPHTRFAFAVEGCSVAFHDARRFGRVGCALPELGPEPLSDEFDAGYLFRELRGRTASVKAMLMDQRLVAGLGNIYATEALFTAGIRPARRSGTLSRADCERLAAAVKKTIAEAVLARGSTLEDTAYLDPLGRPGDFQHKVAVYGRKTGACGHALKTTLKPIGGRTSRYCPVCQK